MCGRDTNQVVHGKRCTSRVALSFFSCLKKVVPPTHPKGKKLMYGDEPGSHN